MLKCTCYLENIGMYSEFNEVYLEYFSDDATRPARVCFAGTPHCAHRPPSNLSVSLLSRVVSVIIVTVAPDSVVADQTASAQTECVARVCS